MKNDPESVPWNMYSNDNYINLEGNLHVVLDLSDMSAGVKSPLWVRKDQASHRRLSDLLKSPCQKYPLPVSPHWPGALIYAGVT